MTTTPDKRPRGLTTAIVIIWLQAVANLGLGIFLAFLASSEAEHGQDATFTGLAAAVSVVAGPVLVVGAVGLAARRSWVRVPLAVVEILIILNGLLTVVLAFLNGMPPTGIVGIVLAFLNGMPPTGIVGIVLAALVLQAVFSGQTEDWLEDQPS